MTVSKISLASKGSTSQPESLAAPQAENERPIALLEASGYARAHQLTLKRPAPASSDDETLQMLCRLGYTDQPAPATPRRPLTAFVRT